MTVPIVVAAALSAALTAAIPTLAASAAVTPATVTQNPGDASPSLSLSVSPGGQPEIASIGKNGSLWFTIKSGGKWHRTQLAKAGAVTSGPSLIAENSGSAILAVDGPSHSLEFYYLVAGKWHHTQVAGKNTTYSAPSLGEGPNEPGIAAEGPSHSLRYYALKSGKWHGVTINGKNTAFSAPSLVIRQSTNATPTDHAGEVDIAVENDSHSLSYYNSLPGGHWQNDVIGTINTTYSAPSLVILSSVGRAADIGVPLVAAEGPKHSLVYYVGRGTWESELREGNNWVYSAPSFVQGGANTNLAVAFQGSSHSLFLTFLNVAARAWQNDLVVKAFSAYSAPALIFRNSNPVAELDVAVQGPSNQLTYFSAPPPPSTDAPTFTGFTVAGKGTTFGG